MKNKGKMEKTHLKNKIWFLADPQKVCESSSPLSFILTPSFSA
jgi:hypothetical protein